MKYYGFKTSHFGKAYRTENIDRKRARQEGKKEGEDRG